MVLPNQYSTSQQESPCQGRCHEVTEGFKSWLISKSYSSSTIRNYIADVNKYIFFLRSKIDDPTSIFSPDSVSQYLTTLQKDSNINRYLSSLSKFFQFAIDQHLVSVDPLKIAQKPKTTTPSDILADYQSFLSKKHFSTSTIKNYLNDIQQFIDWTQNKSESI